MSNADGAPPTRRVPRRFLALAGLVSCHRDPARWAALYRVLWRLAVGGEPRLLEVGVDADVLALTRMAKAVRREVHKLHAFVRFRAVAAPDGGEAFVAWIEPEHDVLRRAAPFFARRFPNMRWAILTPHATAHWDGRTLAFGPGVPAASAPSPDDREGLWGTYYANIFNPARVKVEAMRGEMPKKWWRNLPEARLIDGMVRGAPARVRAMVEEAGKAGAGRAGTTTLTADVEGRTWAGGDVTAGRGAARTGNPDGREGGATAWAPVRVAGSEVRLGTVGWGGQKADGAKAGGDEDDRAERGGGPAPVAQLGAYAARFGLVEVDATFGALPTRALAAAWAAHTPPGFVFDVRAHALLTGHPVEPWRLPRRVRDLLPPSLAAANRLLGDEVPARVREAVWDDFLGALAPLGAAGKLGAVLLRLPSWLAPGRAGADALAAARAALGGWAAAVEFGHPGWLAPRVRTRALALLERLAFAHTVVAGLSGGAAPAAVTHPGLAVVRLRGRREAPAAGPAELAAVVEQVAERAAETHVLLDRPAPGDAARLAAALRGRAG